MRRGALILVAAALLAAAFYRMPNAAAGQAAVSLSREGQEDLTFWANHKGLEQLDALGAVGFGDFARILMRRRGNAEIMRGVRDRFTFRVRKIEALNTPDVFRVDLTDSGPVWRNKPERFVIGADKTFNLPLAVNNLTPAAQSVAAVFRGSSAESSFSAAVLNAQQAGGFLLRVVESQPGMAKGRLSVRAGGKELDAEIAFDVRALGRLRVSIADNDGQPVASRVYLTGSDGLAYAPRGSISRMTAMSAEYYFHSQPEFEIELPAGETLIEATRGQEYGLTSQRVAVVAGRVAHARVRLKRWTNMAAQGWHSADAHIHANYTAPHHQVITPDDVRLQTLAEDLNNANMMVANSGGAFIHDAQQFEGRPHALSRPGFLIYWNEEMRNGGIYGHMSFFNLKSLVHPLYTGFRDTPQWEDYPPNYTQAEAAMKQGGAVTYVHPTMEPTFDATSSRELPVDLALGQVDAMDVVSNLDEFAAAQLWYRLLNCGFRLAISAGTDSFTNVADHYTPGGGRVYVQATDPASQEWVANYKRGRSFASTGPVMTFGVNGRLPGDELRLPAGAAAVKVRGVVRTNTPLDKVEIIVNGSPVISRAASGKNEIQINESLALKGSSWIALRAQGPWNRLILNDTHAFAHTSPVYVYVGEGKIAVRADAAFYVDWIERLIARVEQRGRFAGEARKREVIDLFRRALAIYREIERNGASD
jgi:hypothetical protein